MPQLNPAPWFAIFMFSWLVFLLVLLPKTLAHTFPNDPAPQGAKTLESPLWNWPWL